MRKNSIIAIVFSLMLALSVGCSTQKANVPDVKDQVSKALSNAGLNDVKVDLNNDKQLVTLKGDVKSDDEKTQAEQVAESAAPGFVVSNEIGVRPEGAESAAAKIDSNLDSAIEKDFKAVMIANGLDKQHIRFDAKNGVLTLRGNVDNAAERARAEKLAAQVSNVQQVVNELDVKGDKKHKSAGM